MCLCISIIIVFAILLIIGLTLYFVVPLFFNQLINLLSSLGEVSNDIANKYGIDTKMVNDTINKYSNKIIKWIGEIIASGSFIGVLSKSVDYLVKMPNQFRAMIVEKFAEQLGLFENNIGVLELIASHGSKASIMELVKVITKKMMTSGQELNAVSLIGKLHYCNKKNYNQLVSCITNIPDDVISEEDKKYCFEHLDEIVPKK